MKADQVRHVGQNTSVVVNKGGNKNDQVWTG